MRKPNQHYKEAESLSRMTTIFGRMTKKQVATYLGKSDEEAFVIMRSFGRMRKGYFDGEKAYISPSKTGTFSLSKALSVYLDFLQNGIVGTPFASKDLFVACIFVDPGENILYELIHIPFGEEVMASEILSKRKQSQLDVFQEQRKIVILDGMDRMEFVYLPDVFSYCIVDENGEVFYFG